MAVRNHGGFWKAALVGLLFAATGPLSAQQMAAIGAVSTVQPDAFGTPPGAGRRTLDPRMNVFANERIDTAERGWVEMLFLDETRFRVGGNSTVMLDRFVFDPDRKTGELTLNVTQGMFRFVTGGMQKEAYRIRTPHAVIGVRGTDFLLRVTATETSVAVIDGTVLMASLLPGAQGSAVPAGNAARNAAGGIQVSPVPAGTGGSESRTQAWFDAEGALGGGSGGGGTGPTGGFGITPNSLPAPNLIVTPPPAPPPMPPKYP
jgi:hypothetical protein